MRSLERLRKGYDTEGLRGQREGSHMQAPARNKGQELDPKH